MRDKISETGTWVKNNPGKAVCLVGLAFLSGGAVGYLLSIKATMTVGVVCGTSLGLGVTGYGLKNGLEMQSLQQENQRLRNVDSVRDGLLQQLDAERERNAQQNTALQQNATTLNAKDQEILRLNTQLAQRQAPIAQVLTPIPPVAERGMFNRTEIRRRTHRNASDEPGSTPNPG